MTAEPYRVNNSGSSLSSPSHLHPCTKPFSGRPARPHITLSYTRGWGSFEREAWNCLPTVAAHPTPRHQRRHRSRSAQSCCYWTPSPAAHCCRHWDRKPAPSTRRRAPGSPQSAVAIALWECSGRPSARRPMDTGVINTTPFINKV